MMSPTEYENICLETISSYRAETNQQFQALSSLFQAKLEECKAQLEQQADAAEAQIRKNLEDFQTQGVEQSARTTRLTYKMPKIDGAINKLMSWISTEMKIKHLLSKAGNQTQQSDWVWSNKKKGREIKVSKEGKLVSTTGGRPDNMILIDQKLTEGEHTWKIKSEMDLDDTQARLGVCTKDKDINGGVGGRCPVWCIDPASGWRHTPQTDWQDWTEGGCRRGDVFEFTLKIFGKRGKLSVKKNKRKLGVLTKCGS